ncbi:MAG: hypothetical protein IPK03_03275 [Bacteroidetes bacterium]|nr:hypothetical protein [Bacteroidota bacterium]
MPEEVNNTYIVKGQILSTSITDLSSYQVEVYDRSLRSETLLATTTADIKGYYWIDFERTEEAIERKSLDIL